MPLKAALLYGTLLWLVAGESLLVAQEAIAPVVPAVPAPAPEVIIRKSQRLDVMEMLGPDAPRPTITLQEGTTATKIRNAGGGMTTDVSAEMAIPRPLATWAELTKLQGNLTKLVPWLNGAPAPVISPLYHALYRAKWELASQRMTEGMPAPEARAAYDLDTIWELPAAEGRPAALLLQGRFRLRAETSPAAYLQGPLTNPTAIPYNPRTAYRWKGETPATARDAVKASLRIQTELRNEYAVKGLPRSRNRELETALEQRQGELTDLPKWNYLDAAQVPFISLPLLLRQFPEYAPAPHLGDLAVVIVGNAISPALWGDEVSDPSLGHVSEAVLRELDRQNKPGQVTPLERGKDYDFTVILFLGTAPAEPAAVTIDQLRERVGKFTPLPPPPAPPLPAPVEAPVATPVGG